MERTFDILLSSMALLLLFPVLFLVALILKFTGEGEIFFFQERMGKDGKIFNLIKFATMLKDSPNIGTLTVTVKEDPRILPVGKLLRKTKINELPQLLNILLGDMSLIGPRPLTLQTFNSYSVSTQKVIQQVRPGLSGVGSIIFRDEENILAGTFASVDFYENTIAPYKGTLEEWYVSNKSITVYFKAIFLTVLIIIFPSSQLVWKVFGSLPKPPTRLRQLINYPK